MHRSDRERIGNSSIHQPSRTSAISTRAVTVADWPQDTGVDAQALTDWLDTQAIGTGPISNAVRLTGGTQNILLRFTRDGHDYVLRRPPLVPRPGNDKLMMREGRLLAALTDSAVQHPRLAGICRDESVIGAVFYVMDAVDGFNPTVEMPASVAASPTIRQRMGLELADALAALAGVDVVAAGLEDFGKPNGFLERQVGRWASELEGYARFDAWTGHSELGSVSAVGDWLQDYCPSESRVGIIHGDYHIGNVIYGEDGALRAVVDWEMATLGDPLVDLGRLLISWPQDGRRHPFTMRVEPLDGFPDRAAMAARYGERSGRDLTNLPWFEVLACYKLGIIFEGTYARAQSGQADQATGERLHRSAVALLSLARSIVASN